jgi:hypothetical protein
MDLPAWLMPGHPVMWMPRRNESVNMLAWNPMEKVLKPNLSGRLSPLPRGKRQA